MAYYRRKRYKTHSLAENQIFGIILGCIGLGFGGVYVVQNTSITATLPLIPLAIVAVGVLLLLAFVLSWLQLAIRKRLTLGKTLATIDAMDGFVFEKYMAELMRLLGYETKVTVASGDFGVDILAFKDGISYAVQTKRYKSTVGIEAIQQAVAGKYHYRSKRAMVVTNGTFTKAAKTLAHSNYCTLVDRQKLAQWIEDAHEIQTTHSK